LSILSKYIDAPFLQTYFEENNCLPELQYKAVKLDEEMISTSLHLEELATPQSLEMVIDGLRCILWPPLLQSRHKQALGAQESLA
jgi:hypothetical protein